MTRPTQRIPGVWRGVGPLLATRLLANVALRFPYTYARTLANGLGVDLETITQILGVRELGGLVTPLTGRLADRGHLRRVAGWSGAAAGVALSLAAWGGVWGFGIAMAIGGIATFSLYVAQNSFLGHAVPIQQRAAVFGVVETSWAGAFLIGVPLVGWVISAWGWRAAFWVVGPLLTLVAVWSSRRLAESSPHTTSTNDDGAMETPGGDHHLPIPPRRVVRIPHQRAVAVFVFAQPMAQMLLFAVYGDWFETSLDLSVTELGLATAMLGIAELVGTLSTVAISDRFGPARIGWITIAAAAPAMALLGTVGGHAVWGVALVVTVAVLIECSFVSVLPIITELDPSQRGATIARMTVVITISRALGSPLAGALYTGFGIATIGWISAAMCVLGAGALVVGTSNRWATLA